ncbi:glucose-1-phosphate cytidylyltransferase [Sneathiella litorea]|uniref:Glucose-1-phosphate cytidylyltransferase n=1 Tax=Sneathiella litorea TaxID=2606216 RepID=A0A6L8W818_9PROT|nr:glucose-1-phosphate cytidylyltransferase [Sneathiella litorea]MZR31225.1 glucose-1-phosphate cytidylyltransferase [Sneathiella litorea]
MKAVILAGGLGTRISEESHLKPKPMIEIGNYPILWHIMKIYSHYGIHDFVICLGYRSYVIKEYFANYFLHRSDVTFDLESNQITYHKAKAEPWRVTLVETGENTMTGGRLKRVASYLEPNETFCMTYGDGVADVDIAKLISFHKTEGREATLTAVAPPGRFGATVIENGAVKEFVEKPAGDNGLINGGFFVLEPSVLARISGDDMPWENDPLTSLAADNELSAYRHRGFWQPMDTLREKNYLEQLWANDKAPWRVWD